jgi:hypothetical protein
MRVAYQAGALKALIDAGLTFEHADGTSGGTMNLAMMFSGLTPGEMIDRWISLDPKGFVSFLPPADYLRLEGPRALGDADGVLKDVFPHLGIDADCIRRATGMQGTFNVCNFTTKTNRVVAHTEMSTDFLVAGISLPIFMPPVRVGSDDYVDSVWIKDANLLEAVQRGAEEIWVVWCIGNAPDYRGGPFHQYVHMIELSANGALFAELAYIRELNQRIVHGDSPYGQRGPIRVKIVKPDEPLPLDPAYFLGTVDAKTLVARGYSDAARRLERSDVDDQLDATSTQMRAIDSSVSFREHWTGTWSPREGEAGDNAWVQSAFELEVSVFIHRLEHFLLQKEPAQVFGRVRLGGSWVWLDQGDFRCVSAGERRRHLHRLRFRRAGRSYVLEVERQLRGGTANDQLADLKKVSLSLYAGAPSEPALASAEVSLDLSDLRNTARGVRAIEPESALAGGTSIVKLCQHLFHSAYERHLRRKRCWLHFW